MKFERSFLLLFLAFALPAFARPAPWFKWRSSVDSRTVCAQTSPGEGWIKVAQPYDDAHCTRPFLKLPTDAKTSHLQDSRKSAS